MVRRILTSLQLITELYILDRERPFVLADFPSNTTFYAVVKDRPHKPGEKPPVDVYLRSMFQFPVYLLEVSSLVT